MIEIGKNNGDRESRPNPKNRLKGRLWLLLDHHHHFIHVHREIMQKSTKNYKIRIYMDRRKKEEEGEGRR